MNLKKVISSAIIFMLLSFPVFSADEGGDSLSYKGLDVKWTIEDGYIVFDLTAKATGWISIGFEPTSMMKDADIIIGYVKDGILVIEDQFGTSFTSHKSDISLGGTDDIVPLSGSEVDGTTNIKFKKPMKSQDKFDKSLNVGKAYKFIVAYSNRDDFKSMHVFKKTSLITLK